MKKKSYLVMTMLTGILLMSSCASKKDLDNCRLDNQSLQNENKELNTNYQVAKEQLAASNARVSSLEEQLAQSKNAYRSLQKSLDKSLANSSQNNISIEKLVDQINESNQYIRHLTNLKSKSDSLNMVLTNNLTRSLSKEELKEVDVQVLKGVVYISLADNMLYKSGSYEINDRASETLSKIAKIIKDYKDYDVLIEGNTDDVPISRENIRNNWDLSCLRASSVVQALVGVNATRWPAMLLKLVSSATVAPRSSSLRNSTSLWNSSRKHRRNKKTTRGCANRHIPVFLSKSLEGVPVHSEALFQQIPEEFGVVHEVAFVHSFRFLQKTIEPLHVQLAPDNRCTLDVTRLEVDGGAKCHPNVHTRHQSLVLVNPLLLFGTAYSHQYDVGTRVIDHAVYPLILLLFLFETIRRRICPDHHLPAHLSVDPFHRLLRHAIHRSKKEYLAILILPVIFIEGREETAAGNRFG